MESDTNSNSKSKELNDATVYKLTSHITQAVEYDLTIFTVFDNQCSFIKELFQTRQKENWTIHLGLVDRKERGWSKLYSLN